MSLSTAFNIITSSFAANAAQTAVVSNNIANVNTTGYSKEVANLVANSYGGVDVASVTRLANAALTEQVSTSTSQAASQQAIANGLSTLAATVDDSSSTSSTSGANENGASPSAMLANLQTALTTYEDSPTSTAAADAAVTAATDLAQSLNAGDAAVNQVREQADQDMASSVSTINSLLGPVPDRQQHGRQRTCVRRECRKRRGHARFAGHAARAADRRDDHDRRQRFDVDLHRQRHHPFSEHAEHGLLHAPLRPTSTA